MRLPRLRRLPLLVITVLALFCMAPTAGDIGGCGSEVQALDPTVFAGARKELDCRRCAECSVSTARCKSACDPNKPPDTAIPKTCEPLFHDGEVCLRRLDAVSCDVYKTYVSDVAPSTTKLGAGSGCASLQNSHSLGVDGATSDTYVL